MTTSSVVQSSEDPQHAYIDHALSANLDSTFAFEGPEKLLEIWFYPNELAIPGVIGMRSIAVEEWIQLLKLVNCEILSVKKTSDMDAFLLSESSMFVFDHKLTLKTCGTTTTLNCLKELFQLLETRLGWDCQKTNGKYNPYKVFYSRRCFMFPAKQRFVHRNWNDEVDYLNHFFHRGKSYLVGRNDQNNHWNLYITETNKNIVNNRIVEDEEDETLEVLMTGLDAERAQMFVSGKYASLSPTPDEKPENHLPGSIEATGHIKGLAMTKETKLDNIYENNSGAKFIYDAFAFTPCGYSSNMIVDEKYYYTLHVTPEKGWSYASFESTLPVETISMGKQTNLDVLDKVLDVFRPSDFCLTFFTKESLINEKMLKLLKLFDGVSNYIKKDKIIHDLDDYQLIYLRYQRLSPATKERNQ